MLGVSSFLFMEFFMWIFGKQPHFSSINTWLMVVVLEAVLSSSFVVVSFIFLCLNLLFFVFALVLGFDSVYTEFIWDM